MWLHVPRSTSFHSAPVAADSISASRWQFQTLAQSCWWRGKRSPSPVWFRRWKAVSWLRHLCGAMCEPSMADRGAALWMASLAESHASRIPLQESDSGPTTSVTYGPTLGASSSSPGHGSSSSKTSKGCSRQAGQNEFGVIFEDLVSRLRLDCLLRQKLARRTNERASLSSQWRTPTDDTLHGGAQDVTKRLAGGHAVNLQDQVKSWPTPDASVMQDGEKPETFIARKGRVKLTAKNGNGMGTPLPAMAAQWPTPRSHEVGEYQYSRGDKTKPIATLTGLAQQWQTPSGDRSNEMLLNGQSETISRSIHQDQATSTHGKRSSNDRRSLNPLFVEWLMGWPEGWTAFECSATALTRYKRRMRSALFALGLPDDPPSQPNLFG